MGVVFLDGEEVDFNGPAPTSVSDIWNLLDGFLNQSGMLIRSMSVDGADWNLDSGASIDSFSEIRVSSMTQLENVVSMVTSLCEQMEERIQNWRDVSTRILTCSWNEVQPDAISNVESMSPMIQLIEILVDFGSNENAVWAKPLSEAGQTLNNSLGALIDTFEPRNSVLFSDIAAIDMVELLSAIDGLLRESVLPSLNQLVEG